MVSADGSVIGRLVTVEDARQQPGAGTDRQRAGLGDIADLPDDIGAGFGQSDNQDLRAAESVTVAVFGRMDDFAGRVFYAR